MFSLAIFLTYCSLAYLFVRCSQAMELAYGRQYDVMFHVSVPLTIRALNLERLYCYVRDHGVFRSFGIDYEYLVDTVGVEPGEHVPLRVWATRAPRCAWIEALVGAWTCLASMYCLDPLLVGTPICIWTLSVMVLSRHDGVLAIVAPCVLKQILPEFTFYLVWGAVLLCVGMFCLLKATKDHQKFLAVLDAWDEGYIPREVVDNLRMMRADRFIPYLDLDDQWTKELSDKVFIEFALRACPISDLIGDLGRVVVAWCRTHKKRY